MKTEPSEMSCLETECLFGECIQIHDEYKNWYYCTLTTDQYCGWVNKKGLGKLKKPTHRVIAKRTFIFNHKDVKSNCLFYLPMGSKIAVKKIECEWSEIDFSISKQKKIGYVPTKHIVDLDHRVKDWVATAEKLEGIPYKWGGRNTIGLDCSALLQLSYQTYGENIPRNTSDQIKLEKKIVSKIVDLRRGCVVFWEGHVGIMIDEIHCIHANAFNMSTNSEELRKIISRMDKETKIKKMMDFY